MDLSVTCNNPLVVGRQRAKKVVSDSSGLVDFAMGLLQSFSYVAQQASDVFQGIHIIEEVKT